VSDFHEGAPISLGSVVVTCSRRRLQLPQRALDVQSHAHAIEPFRFYCVIILCVALRARSDHALLLLPLPQSKLLSLTRGECREAFLLNLHCRVVLPVVHLICFEVVHLDVPLNVAGAAVVVVALAEEAGFLQVDRLYVGVSLDVIAVGGWRLLAEFPDEEGATLWQVLLVGLNGKVYLL